MLITQTLKIRDHGLWFWEDDTDIEQAMEAEWNLIPFVGTIEIKAKGKIVTVPHRDSLSFVSWSMGVGTLYVSYGARWWYQTIKRTSYEYFVDMCLYGERSLSLRQLQALEILGRTAPKLLTAEAKKELGYRRHKEELQGIARAGYKWRIP